MSMLSGGGGDNKDSQWKRTWKLQYCLGFRIRGLSQNLTDFGEDGRASPRITTHEDPSSLNSSQEISSKHGHCKLTSGPPQVPRPPKGSEN